MSRVLHRVAANPFESLIAALSVLTSVLRLLGAGPTSSTDVVLEVPYAELWLVSYAGAGLLVLFGIMAGRIAPEAAGLIWLAGAVTINVVALIETLGVSGAVLLPTYFAVILACLARAWVLLRGRDIVLVDRGNGL